MSGAEARVEVEESRQMASDGLVDFVAAAELARDVDETSRAYFMRVLPEAGKAKWPAPG
jgi:hypothetical protein